MPPIIALNGRYKTYNDIIYVLDLMTGGTFVKSYSMINSFLAQIRNEKKIRKYHIHS